MLEPLPGISPRLPWSLDLPLTKNVRKKRRLMGLDVSSASSSWDVLAVRNALHCSRLAHACLKNAERLTMEGKMDRGKGVFRRTSLLRKGPLLGLLLR